MIAPDVGVRHLEGLEDRRPDLNHRRLRARHRMRVVATLTGGSRLIGRSVQIVLLTLVGTVVGLFTGRFGEALLSSGGVRWSAWCHAEFVVAGRRAFRPRVSVP